jgi:hypothetical protein
MIKKRVAAILVALAVVLAGLAGAAPAQAAGVDWIKAPSGEMTKVGKPAKGVQAGKGKPGAATSGMNRMALTYFYAQGTQGSFAAGTEPIGASINSRIATPVLAAGDFHTLGEISAQSANQQQTVEVGWHINPAVTGHSDPALFAGHWINGVWQGYNTGCVDNASNAVNLGANLTTLGWNNTGKYLAIQYFGGNWWVGINNTWVCHFPGTNWSSPTFTKIEFFAAFGEVAANTSTPSTEMGTGDCGNLGALPAAYFASLSYQGTGAATPNLTLAQTDSTKYDTAPSGSTGRSFYYGGDGSSC